MKIWNGYGSEHSMNLVMIGRFKEVRDADTVKKVIDQIAQQVSTESSSASGDDSRSQNRYSDAMLKLLGTLSVNTIGPIELEQFLYDVSVEVEGNTIVVKTDESDISAFLKVLIEKGARVEVYSAHDYPGDEDDNA